MSTDQYTPDELAFIDNVLVGIANACLSDPQTTSMGPEWVTKEALVLLEARRKIRGMAQPTQTAPIASDELATHQFVCTEDVIRGSYLETGDPSFPQRWLYVGQDIGFDSIPARLKLTDNDIVEIRVIERADR